MWLAEFICILRRKGKTVTNQTQSPNQGKLCNYTEQMWGKFCTNLKCGFFSAKKPRKAVHHCPPSPRGVWWQI